MDFNPGFRFSVVDALVLLLGAIATVIVWSFLWYAGFIVAFVLVHFFLFCNVFRVSRLPELVWGGVFSGLATTTILTARPGWLITAVVSLVVTVAVVFRETRKPSYHGILWNTVNPNLRTWWESSEARDGEPVNSAAELSVLGVLKRKVILYLLLDAMEGNNVLHLVL